MAKPNLASEQDMDRAIGHALNSWNRVEDSLGDIFCAAFGGINNLAARGAYMAVINFNARLRMVDAAMAASKLPDDLMKRWSSIHNRADRKAEKRNKLTHFSRITDNTPGRGGTVYVVPNVWVGDEWVKSMLGKGIRWTWPEVWAFGQDFGKFAIELYVLADEVEEHVRAHPPKWPPKVLGP